jgi:hypothetical protein
VCAQVLQERGRSVRDIATEQGVDESTVRYRLQRLRAQADDGRQDKPEACNHYAAIIESWMERQTTAPGRPESVRTLYDLLVCHHGFTGGYKSVLRYVRRRKPPPLVRPVRRVETRPGLQAQVDWVQSRPLIIGGMPSSVRIDNLKIGVAQSAGPWAVLHPGYASYAKQLGFIIDPCRVRTPQDKGKVERRGHDVKHVMVRGGERFATIAGLQSAMDQRILDQSNRLLCPVTGTTIHAAWRQDRAALAALSMTLPEPFDVQVSRRVGRDCLVAFEGRQYSLPYHHVGASVDVRGCVRTVEIYRRGDCIARFPRYTDCGF